MRERERESNVSRAQCFLYRRRAWKMSFKHLNIRDSFTTGLLSPSLSLDVFKCNIRDTSGLIEPNYVMFTAPTSEKHLTCLKPC